MKSETWRTFARWLLVAPVGVTSLLAAYVALMASVLLDQSCIRWTDGLRLHLPTGIFLGLLDLIVCAAALAIWTVPTAFAIGFALRLRVSARLQWGFTVSLLLAGASVWWREPCGSSAASHIVVVAAAAVLVCGIVLSFLKPRRTHLHLLANIVALVLMTLPCWIAFALAPQQPASAQKLWSVVLQKETWGAMNTGSSFASRRQVVFAGDRILVVFDAGSAGYEGKQPMSTYRLLSLDMKTGLVKDSKELAGYWGHMPYLYATNDGHAILADGSLTSLNPDLSAAGPQFTMSRGRAIQVSPDGSTMAWETNPGTTLLDSHTLTPVGKHLAESVPTSVSAQAVVTDNVYWYGQYPTDRAFVTLTDEHGQHLLFHGDCGGRPEFLSNERVLLAGCNEIRILDVRGRLLREAQTVEDQATFAGVSQNGKRFGLVFSAERGDPAILLYEHFIIYDTETAQPVAMVRTTDMPERQSWSAFSADAQYFAAGNPNDLSLYRLL